MRYGIGFRLTAGFALIGAFMLCIAAMGLLGLRSLNSELQHIVENVENRYPKIEQLHNVIDEIASISIAIRGALIADKQPDIDAQIARVNSEPQTVSGLLEQLDTAFLSEDEAGQKLQQYLHDNNGRYLVEIIKVTRAATAGSIATPADCLSHQPA